MLLEELPHRLDLGIHNGRAEVDPVFQALNDPSGFPFCFFRGHTAPANSSKAASHHTVSRGIMGLCVCMHTPVRPRAQITESPAGNGRTEP